MLNDTQSRQAEHLGDRELLLEIFRLTLSFESRIMTAISEALAADAAALVALTVQVAASNSKVDALIALAQSAGVSQADIDAAVALKATADAATASLAAEAGKVDAALPAAPAPAPSEPPVAG